MRERTICNHEGEKKGNHIIHATRCNEEQAPIEDFEVEITEHISENSDQGSTPPQPLISGGT